MRIGVVLFNLGSPDKLENIEPFLINLFSDEEIFKIPFPFLRKTIAVFIAKIRKRTTKKFYTFVGGESPLFKYTMAQAKLLEDLLKKEIDARVYVAMRYWHPYTEEVMDSIKNEQFDKIIFLPLYPQFSFATTGSFRKHLKKLVAEKNIQLPELAFVESYYNDKLFIGGIINKIEEAVERENIRSFDKSAIILSAHSLPNFLIKEKDPYLEQIQETATELEKELKKRFSGTMLVKLAYQSRLKFSRWLKPYVIDVVKDFYRKGIREIIIVPISFVSDNIETVYELGVVIKEASYKIGIRRYILVECLNESGIFIRCLRNKVMESIL